MAARWVSGTGGWGQSASLSHLGGFSPSAFDRLTRIHPPAQKEPRAHVRTVDATLPHSLQTHKHLPALSYWRSLGGTRELC